MKTLIVRLVVNKDLEFLSMNEVLQEKQWYVMLLFSRISRSLYLLT